MNVLVAGFFRELGHGEPDGPSLVASAAKVPDGDKARIASYLERGCVVAVSSPAFDDFLDDAQRAIAPAHVLTDGVWVWPADLAYYVRRCGVGIPPEFLAHMERADWDPADLSAEEIKHLRERWMKG